MLNFEKQDDLSLPISIKIGSTSELVHNVHAETSNPNIILIQFNCGQLRQDQQLDIEVKVNQQAFEEIESASITLHIGNSKVEIPVYFI